jgi:hypothetical protein
MMFHVFERNPLIPKGLAPAQIGLLRTRNDLLDPPETSGLVKRPMHILAPGDDPRAPREFVPRILSRAPAPRVCPLLKRRNPGLDCPP